MRITHESFNPRQSIGLIIKNIGVLFCVGSAGLGVVERSCAGADQIDRSVHMAWRHARATLTSWRVRPFAGCDIIVAFWTTNLMNIATVLLIMGFA